MGRKRPTPESTSKDRIKSSVTRIIWFRNWRLENTVNVQELHDFEWCITSSAPHHVFYWLNILFFQVLFQTINEERNRHLKMKRAACRQQNNSQKTEFTLSWFKLRLITILLIELTVKHIVFSNFPINLTQTNECSHTEWVFPKLYLKTKAECFKS